MRVAAHPDCLSQTLMLYLGSSGLGTGVKNLCERRSGALSSRPGEVMFYES